MAIKLYTPSTVVPFTDPDTYIKVEERSWGLTFVAVTREGKWRKDLFTLYSDRGIVRNYSAQGAGFPTDTGGRILVEGGGK